MSDCYFSVSSILILCQRILISPKDRAKDELVFALNDILKDGRISSQDEKKLNKVTHR